MHYLSGSLTGLVTVLTLPLLVAQPPPPVVARPRNPEEVQRRLGLLPGYAAVPGIRDVKIAVLDSGFDGVDGKRPYLPASAVVVEDYDPDFIRRFRLGDPEYRKPFLPGNSHGCVMAQLVWAVTGNSPPGPKFYLLNANGPTLFRRAIRYAIEQKIDVILFSGTFEGAGNYDGRGPINAAVDEAVAAGIIWVNAAGNCGGRTYNGPIDVGPDGFLRFGIDRQTALRFRNRLDENALTLTLTWNDYRDVEDAGTEKDLDLIVEDARGRVVGESRLKQIGPGRDAGAGESKNPRERVTLTDLAANATGESYRIRIQARGTNFGPRDRLRLLLTPARETPILDPQSGKTVQSIEFLSASRGGEIYPPADHPGVLTVGDASPASAIGPTADGRVKPDVIVSDSSARFSNGEESVGASNAAAYFAGVVVAMRAVEPGLTTAHVREWVRELDRGGSGANVGIPRPGPVLGPAVPFAPQPLMSPNQLRARRYVQYALEEKRLRGETNPLVVTSMPGRTNVMPGDLLDESPAVIGVANTAVAGPLGQPVLLHVPWRTPSPRQLAILVRGTP